MIKADEYKMIYNGVTYDTLFSVDINIYHFDGGSSLGYVNVIYLNGDGNIKLLTDSPENIQFIKK